MSKKIYLIRHGETDYNRQGIVQGSGVDSSLNDKGRRQAALFHERYGHLPFELIVTSKLKRTHETVAHFLAGDAPHVKLADINEMSWGGHEGKKSTPAMIEEYQTIKDGWALGQIDGRIAGGESAREMSLRLARFIEFLRERPESLILVCSHGRAMCGLVTLMKGKPINCMNELAHSNTGLWLAEQTEADFTFHLENDREHLAELANEKIHS